MPNTSNYNWPTPADTDLVKDGAAAIRDLGDGVDTSLVDLLGGTTGQVLTKASNTDLDFSFTTPSGSPLTTKGDLYTFGTGDTRLPVGANGTILVADSSTATGLAYAAPGGALSIAEIATGTLSGTSVTISSLSSYDKLFLRILNGGSTSGNGNQLLRTRINNNSGSNYLLNGWEQEISDGSRTTGFSTETAIIAQNDFMFGTGLGALFIQFDNCKSAGFTTGQALRFYTAPSQANGQAVISFIYKQAEAVSSLVLTLDGSATFNSGTFTVWGA